MCRTILQNLKFKYLKSYILKDIGEWMPIYYYSAIGMSAIQQHQFFFMSKQWFSRFFHSTFVLDNWRNTHQQLSSASVCFPNIYGFLKRKNTKLQEIFSRIVIVFLYFVKRISFDIKWMSNGADWPIVHKHRTNKKTTHNEHRE